MSDDDATERRRARLLGLVLTSAFAAVVAVALGALAAQVVVDPVPVFVLLGIAWATLTAGRVLWYADLPRGHGGVAAELALGAALGVVGMGAIRAFVVDGPEAWALVAGLGFGAVRAHAPIMRAIRGKGEAAPRLVAGILDPREVGALALLVAGYVVLGVAAYNVFSGFTAIIPDSAKALRIGLAIYALYGLKLLLKFASHDTGPVDGGFLAWFKANLLRNAIIALVLVAYAVYRDDLAPQIPYFPLVEFGLGLAVFGAVIARLRWLLRKQRTDHATASAARPHVQRVEPLTEGEYEAVARPLSRFLETGRGAGEYEAVVVENARLGREAATDALAPLRRYRAPIEDPPLPLAYAVGAAIVGGVGFALAGGVLLYQLLAASSGDGVAPPEALLFAIDVAIIIAGLGTYRAQDAARAHRRPGVALAVAGIGAALVGIGNARLLGPLLGASLLMWGALGAGLLLMVGVPAFLSWRLSRRIAEGQATLLAPEPPSAALDKGLAAAKRLAVSAALGAVVLLVLVPFVLGWLVQVAHVPEGVSTTYDGVASAAVWALAAMGGSALVRYYGFAKARPDVLAREKRWRDERLALHSEIMRRLERI